MENVLVDRAPVRLRRPARLLRLASDERLVALVRAGDEGAFEALYDRHHPAILGFCRHMLGSREEAEDALQHTFLAAYRDLARHEQPIDLRPWLFAIARNRCLSLLRARRAHVAIELAEPATDGLAATVERREDLRELLADLADLPEDQRAALLLAELGALDHAGIAAVLDCPREKVKALVFQARASLAASREARATPCADVRTELATASGAALRRGPLRRHLRTCDGCRAFKTEVATQRKLLALALPVVPSVALKASVLGGGGGASAASGGATASGGAFGALGTAASTGAGKAALSLAVAGAIAGGALTTQIERHDRNGVPAAAHASGPRAIPAPPFARSAHPARHGGTRSSHVRHAAGEPSPHPHHAAALRTPGATGEIVPSLAAARAPEARSLDAGGASAQPVPDAPALGADPVPAPKTGHSEQHRASATAPGRQHSRQPGAQRHDHGAVPPGSSRSPTGESHASDGAAPPSSGSATPAPGQSGDAHGQAGDAHGQAGDAHGQAGEAHGQPGDAHGHAG